MKRLALLLLLSLQAHAVSRLPANIVGEVDGRGPISTKGLDIGLSPAEVAQIRSAVGYFVCPGTEHGNEIGATGFLVRDDIVVTVAHAFYDEKGIQRSPWKECYYQTQDGANYRVKIDPVSIRVGTSAPSVDRLNDYAVVRLTSPIETATPLTIVQPAPQFAPWMTIYPVGAYREANYAKGESKEEPLVQMCYIRRPFEGSKKFPASYYSDCDNTAGGSGGPNLIRMANGRLVVAGIFSSAGFPDQDFQPYYEQQPAAGQPSKLSLAYSVQPSGAFLAAIQAMMAQPLKKKSVQSVVPSASAPAPAKSKKTRSDFSSGFLIP